jgi:hypothetical protein
MMEITNIWFVEGERGTVYYEVGSITFRFRVIGEPRYPGEGSLVALEELRDDGEWVGMAEARFMGTEDGGSELIFEGDFPNPTIDYLLRLEEQVNLSADN